MSTTREFRVDSDGGAIRVHSHFKLSRLFPAREEFMIRLIRAFVTIATAVAVTIPLGGITASADTVDALCTEPRTSPTRRG